MSVSEIVELIGLGAAILIALVTIIGSIVKGKLKDFIIKKMEEAEDIYKDVQDKTEKALMKFNYVLKAVKEEYKLAALILDVKKFIEKVIKVTKKINYNKEEK